MSLQNCAAAKIGDMRKYMISLMCYNTNLEQVWRHGFNKPQAEYEKLSMRNGQFLLVWKPDVPDLDTLSPLMKTKFLSLNIQRGDV